MKYPKPLCNELKSFTIRDALNLLLTDHGLFVLTFSSAGKSDLKVVRVEQTTVKMTWTPFLTEPGKYEYSVLYTTDFSLSLLQWNSHGVSKVEQSWGE